MSGTSPIPPSSPNARHPTRTLGFIKSHALVHRLSIERKIVDAGFDIIKERQMEFSADSDREVLEELFGNDARGLNDAPIWVYVLERPRAIETLHSLMGSEDPQDARELEPQSIRALYGVDAVNNAFGGSVDSAAAEAQIAALFASSPPFPTQELPHDSTVRSMSSSVLEQLRAEENSDAAHYASSVRTSGAGSAKGSGSTPTKTRDANGKPVFRARPVPATNVVGTVQPRMTKAAALRMGIQPASVATTKPRASSTGELAGKKHFLDVPGHKRSQPIAVASTARPTIAPRPTKASSLREGKPVEVLRPRQSLDLSRTEIFRNVPGHKRSETLEVPSVKPPVVAPRSNRSASLRQNKEAAPPSSFMFKGPVEPKVPPALTTRRSTSSLAQIEDQKQARRVSMGARPPSAQNVLPPASISTPEIAPRSNRSAMLRAAKMAATPAKPTKA